DLYRITYNGKENTETVKATPITEENKLRRQLEEYHVPKQGAVDIAWPQLRNNDRFIRYAARIALEHQPVAQWQDKVFAEKDPVTLIQSAVALARQGKPDAKNKLIGLLNGIDAGSLSAAQKVDLSRAYELVFLRMGMPEGSLKEQTITVLDKQYPANDNMVNRQYSKLLIRLQAPDAVKKTMALMDDAKDDTSYQRTFTQSSDLILRNPQYGLDIAEMLSKVPPAQQTYYAVMLSAAKTGWTPELQQKYFTWFKNASNYRGGKSFMGFINASRKLALANVPKADFAKFNTMSGDSIFMFAGPFVPRQGPQPKGPGRDWKLDEAVKVVDSGLANRNFENGLAMYNASMCSTCHSMRGEGGQIGPDLTQLGTRFSTADMLQAIIEPSKTISDQYAATTFYLKDGKSIVGRLISKDDKKYSISQNPFAPETLREIPVGDVLRTKLSDISIMMPGMINNLNSEELKDLMAFLMAGGNKENDVYKKK
ncbi:MAG: c-type cytochrome, partial [Chitinophagaceae bacterium]